MVFEEPKIRIGDREELLFMLAEAAEIEHNVMACYLYAIWSLKRGEQDGLTADQSELVRAWKDHMTEVAVEEMTHLALVCNLMVAIGGAPHLSRPNFPIPVGNHPGAIDLELFGFSSAFVDHAIFLERPEGMALDDSPEFVHIDDYHRSLAKDRIMPDAQDYASIGHLYRGIYHGFEVLTRKLGEETLFCGDVADQVDGDAAPAPGICTVTDLASAHRAIETIVEQGEGAESHSEDSHYQKFLTMRHQLRRAKDADPAFEPAFPVARNPVLHALPGQKNVVCITNSDATQALDIANSIYNEMLRFLAQGYGRDEEKGTDKQTFILIARELMWCLTPICEHIASLPAGEQVPGINAGMTFSMVRDISRLPPGRGEKLVLRERLEEIAHHSERAFPAGHPLSDMADALRKMAARIEIPAALARQPAPATDRPEKNYVVGREEGRDMILSFDTKRCVHARQCVLGAPEVFLSGVKGQWLFPDRMETNQLRSICHNCPSGAISYEPKGETPPEPAPMVNTVTLRENGPYAFRAPVSIDGQPVGFRATLCRCGASRNKPFCDNSHQKIGFHATGEADLRDSAALDVRDGALEIRPEQDGPLVVEGNLEICRGTGRRIACVTRARLCRCGGSKTKPFCDGAHKKIGFRSN